MKNLLFIIICVILTTSCAPPLSAQQPQQTQQTDDGEMYPLATCIVSREKIGSMGDAIIYRHEGREIRFCCKSCIPTFQKAAGDYLAKIDKLIAYQQLPFYPMDTCLVSGEKLGGSMGEPINYVYKNRLLRFCCKGCISDFKKNPQKYLAILNQAVIAKQKAGYPLDKCLVSGGKLGSMGEPYEFVYANRLIRFCCDSCMKDFSKNPAKYLTQLEQAYKAKK